MTETDHASNWGTWLATKLDERAWRQADLVRESGGLIKRDRASKWLSGNERPSHRLAIVVANTLGVPHEESLDAAGFTAEAASREKNLEDALAQIDRQFGDKRDAPKAAPSALEMIRVLDQFPDYKILEYLMNRSLRRRVRDISLDQDANVPTPGETQSDYERVARKRSKDRGEDLQ